jgi:hypothetical protein
MASDPSTPINQAAMDLPLQYACKLLLLAFVVVRSFLFFSNEGRQDCEEFGVSWRRFWSHVKRRTDGRKIFMT